MEMEIELVDVQEPDTFEKDVWELTVPEKFRKAVQFREQGTQQYRTGKFKEATQSFETAVAWLDMLVHSPTVTDVEDKRKARACPVEERTPETETEANADLGLTPDEEDLLRLDAIREHAKCCRLNAAACYLKLAEWENVIQHCTALLKHDPHNAKAYFRRAQAYHQLGRDLELSLADLKQAMQLSPDDKETIGKEMELLQRKLTQSYHKERQMFQSIFS